MKLHLNGKTGNIEAIVKRENDGVVVTIGEEKHEFSVLSQQGTTMILSNEGVVFRGSVHRANSDIFVHAGNRAMRFEDVPDEIAEAGDSHQGDLRVIAPMPGTIIKVLVEAGAAVVKGQSLVIVEAMKMENEVRASGNAIVDQVLVSTGERVGFGQELMKLTPPQENGGKTQPN